MGIFKTVIMRIYPFGCNIVANALTLQLIRENYTNNGKTFGIKCRIKLKNGHRQCCRCFL